MMRKAWLGAVLLAVSLSTGCVERTFHITTDQPGALVYHNGVPLGATPVDESFVYWGKHQWTFVKDGYETLHVVENVPAPWYEYPPLEIIVENIWPFTIRENRDLHYTLVPLQKEREDQVLTKAQQLQAQGRAIGEPRRPNPPAAVRTVPGAPAPGAPPGAAPIPAIPIVPPGANPGSAPPPAGPVPPVAVGAPLPGTGR
jgi:hypothetical protein